MARSRQRSSRGFSLLELVIVAVIIGIIAAIAIPRISRGSRDAELCALKGDLAALRKAIEHFKCDHYNRLPTVADITDALTTYSNLSGDDFVPTKDATHIHGPYISAIPPLPVGIRKGCTGIALGDAPDVGWIYDEATGNIKANTGVLEKTVTGKLFKDF